LQIRTTKSLTHEQGVIYEKNGETIMEAAAEIETLRAENERLRSCLGFFASVIKSGERWSEMCEDRYRAALQSKGE
jgi:hypothetical protein